MMSIKFGRFEYTHGSSDKFWECLPNSDGTYSVRYGRIGSSGTNSRNLSYAEAAKKIAEKIAKGYVWVDAVNIDEFEVEHDRAEFDRASSDEVEPDFDFMEELKKAVNS